MIQRNGNSTGSAEVEHILDIVSMVHTIRSIARKIEETQLTDIRKLVVVDVNECVDEINEFVDAITDN